ncbi:hypothetical protein ACRRTK_013920 [Alexandromys fortis]
MCQPSLTPDGNTALTHQDLARGILAKNSNALPSQPYIWVPTWHSLCMGSGILIQTRHLQQTSGRVGLL